MITQRKKYFLMRKYSYIKEKYRDVESSFSEHYILNQKKLYEKNFPGKYKIEMRLVNIRR